MCDYPPALQGLFLAFAALGLLCMAATVLLLLGVRSGERARLSPRLIRYPEPEPVVIPFPPGHFRERLQHTRHEDLFRGGTDTAPLTQEEVADYMGVPVELLTPPER